MFNGIIHNTGKVKYLKKNIKDYYIGIKSNLDFKKNDIGSSVSCNGVCLTITNIKKKIAFFYISKETLNRSNLKFVKLDNIINLEKSLVYGQKISGHFVQGHVDTTATIKKITLLGKTWLIKFLINNRKLSKFLIDKASISINGVSLTISRVENYCFEINVIPHTLGLTNLKKLNIKDTVNIELDIFAKYILKVTS